MASILSLRRRIRAAQNVSKTTRAMQMIAASKLKRAQNASLASKPYVEKLIFLTQNLTSKLGEEQLPDYMKVPKNSNKTLLLVISPDKGLCGSLITNLVRLLLQFNLKNEDLIFITVGKKTEATAAKLKKEIVASFPFGTTQPSFDMVYPIITIIDDYFLNKKVASVKVLSTQFLGVFSQKARLSNILPIELPYLAKPSMSATLFEPKPEILLPLLLRHYQEMILYQHLLESFTSEQAARMIAMQNATDNALEVIEDLKLEYNKTRQEKITYEILDVSSASFSYQYE